MRRILVLGAIAVLRYAKQSPEKYRWLTQLLARRPFKVVAIALANKMARVAWALSPEAAAIEYRSSGRGRPAGSKRHSTVSTWLLSIARFKAISAMRRRQNVELDAETIANFPDPADDPEMCLAQKRDASLLRKGLAQLSPAHAEVLDLVYYHGKAIAEVAAILGIPEPTVKTRMFYARKKLAEIIQAELSQGMSTPAN